MSGLELYDGQTAVDVAAAIAAGGVAPAYIATADFGVTSGTAATAAGQIYLMRLDRLQVSMVLSNASIFVNTAGGNFMIALLTTASPVITVTQAFAATFTRVAATAETAMAGTNVWQDVTFTTPYNYVKGSDLWVAYGGDTIATIARQAVSNVIAPAHAKALTKAAYASNTIPASMTTFLGTALAPLIRLW